MIHGKIRAIDNEIAGIKAISLDGPRSARGMRAAGDRVWGRALEKSAVPDRISPASFGRPEPVDLSEILERIGRIETTLRELIETRDTVRRVGCLELDLIKRNAKRGERQIELLPQEFRLLEYMMRRNNQLLTRATLLADVWNRKFASAANLVDVHMGRVRHKVDLPNEIPMIYNIRGAGFILRAPPDSKPA